jgi:hypothetical protein
MSLPTFTPIRSAPVNRPVATAVLIGASADSVAVSSASRLPARSAARVGLRQAISRSPG